MSRVKIAENVKRRLYAESLGRCMNPNCHKDLFIDDRDIAEQAHIHPYFKTKDNSFENLIILCPNCHTEYDKILQYNLEEVKLWKQIRKDEVNSLFSKKFDAFDDLKREVVPLLLKNETIYNSYYLGNKKELWNKFEAELLVNNNKLKKMLEKNLDLIQSHSKESYSNLKYVATFIKHVDEFEATRLDEEKERQIFFPIEINSIFGIAPVKESILPSTESLEALITKLDEQGKFERIVIGIEDPYILLNEDGKSSKVFFDDTPRLRQLYFEYKCFKSIKVRLDSLNFALKYMNSKGISFEFNSFNNLREITVCGIKMLFIYDYCLSEVGLMQLAPEENSVVINLHNWNGESCISSQAYELSKTMNVTLLTMKGYYPYVNRIKCEK
ncbi:HNH endonuclease [Listeria welshimeri]|uniref:HNH endonuclease signature motif containing protein n=1 Tax=Listeria welshimeri TaxID=1643 RepID=UPI00188846E1|nr:HNH endonuclease signature motif containing protein [Listeria welshimeri]MBF2601561.1 HNH endonuclease [Listeria welshimeri]